ncbi:PD-(D/E)XK nuclease superfamily [Gaiella occulta]|uniref:PD-(D/E)XK nuclease superfamily n=1 Tax=Gaiella occulta TaxID=1002870 RepID=A0A7M2YUG0_9ACTN|nr:PD-(D/E)XK nuclease family protein [Gaiella occulta]RDI73772.1 PD-(D/E)XK nuclease superfamily [Gaiella occulta]
MGLSLVVGPAHAGKVALLLERFLGALEHDPWLIVPNRSDVDRVERELVASRGALLAGTVATFDTLFESIARGGGDEGRRLIGEVERALVVRRVVARAELGRLGGSARFAGFADALAATLTELESSLVDPADLDPDLAALARAYRAELDRLGAWDRGMLRSRALERLTGELAAWDGAPVLAHGFEDLTGAEWRLLEALAARGEVHVSLPYEPGRPAFASLARTAADLARLAGDDIVELPPRSHAFLPPALAHVERHLFCDDAPTAPIDSSIRFLEGAGRRATLELVAEEILGLVAGGTAPEEIAVVCPSLDRIRASVETAFGALGVPYAIEGRTRLGSTPFGQALLLLLRFVWVGGGRRELYGYLRSPYSGLPRADVDWLEGRLRGRAVTGAERTIEETVKLRNGRPLPPLDLLGRGDPPLATARALADHMLRNAYGLGAPPLTAAACRDLRAHDAVARAAGELERLHADGARVEREDVLAALERATVRGDGAGEAGRVAVLDLERARTRRFEAVFVVGLEQGSLPRRAAPSPFLDDDARRALDEQGARLERPDHASRDRYLFATACNRPTRKLILVREAASDEGTAREPSPFWEAVRSLFDADDVRRQTTRRPLSHLTWTFEDAPTERERLRSLAALAAVDARAAEALALANGWGRKLARARRAFSRPTGIRHPRALALLGSRDTFRVTDLERMAGCSSAWFVERYLRPGDIDQEIDARMRGSIAHVALQRFYTQLPSALPGAERVTPENVEEAVVLMRSCVESAIDSGLRIDVGDLQRRELTQSLHRDLEQLVRGEATAQSPFVPRRLEVSFQGYELAPGVAVSGKIDRVDVDPLSARGIVVDYKSGAAPTATQIHDEARLQIPLYMLVLRDQLGLEPMGGVYMPVGGGRRARGMLRAADDQVPGFVAGDYLEPEAFDAEVEHARATAVALAERIRAGDVRHDPRGGECPPWCDLWRMCRKERP